MIRSEDEDDEKSRRRTWCSSSWLLPRTPETFVARRLHGSNGVFVITELEEDDLAINDFTLPYNWKDILFIMVWFDLLPVLSCPGVTINRFCDRWLILSKKEKGGRNVVFVWCVSFPSHLSLDVLQVGFARTGNVEASITDIMSMFALGVFPYRAEPAACRLFFHVLFPRSVSTNCNNNNNMLLFW